MKRPGPGKLETLFGSEKAGPRALKPPTLGPPWPEEKSTKAPPLVTQVKIPPPNIVPHHKPPSNQVSTNPPTKIPKPPITPSPFHPNQQDPKKSQKKRVRKVLQILYKVRALHPQFRGKCDEKNAKNRENSGQAQMHPTAITVMKNFKKKREKKKKTALIRISDIFTEWLSIFYDLWSLLPQSRISSLFLLCLSPCWSVLDFWKIKL